jgi:hypothetical protein
MSDHERTRRIEEVLETEGSELAKKIAEIDPDRIYRIFIGRHEDEQSVGPDVVLPPRPFINFPKAGDGWIKVVAT